MQVPSEGISNGAPRDEKFLEGAGVQFLKAVDAREAQTPFVGHRVAPGNESLPETPDDALDQRTDEIVGGGALAAFAVIFLVGDKRARLVDELVAPLAAIGEIFQSVTHGADGGARVPGLTGLCEYGTHFYSL